MKLSTRVTLLATMLVAPMLGALGYAALRARRADLEADLARQAREVADALRAGIEPLSAGNRGRHADRTRLARPRARRRFPAGDPEGARATRGGPGAPAIPGWLVLLEAAEFQDAARGPHLRASPAGSPSFAMAVPLYDATALALPRRDPTAGRSPCWGCGARRTTSTWRCRHRAAHVPAAVLRWWCSWPWACCWPCAPG